MQPVKQAAAEFPAGKRVAVTGISRKPQGHGSNAVSRRLRHRRAGAGMVRHTTPPPWSPRRRRTRPAPGPPVRGRDDAALTLIKAAHTLAWFSIESCMAYVLYAGAARRTDRRAALAGTVVAGESLIFAANRFRCPLTQLAEHFGAADGSVTDIWLPRWFAHNLPAIHVPLLAAAVYLNGRNLREQRLYRQGVSHSPAEPGGQQDGLAGPGPATKLTGSA
jgi:hypothetical protein